MHLRAKIFQLSAVAIVALGATCGAIAEDSEDEKMERLEARIEALEARLAENEKEDAEQAEKIEERARRELSREERARRQLAEDDSVAFDILAGSAWRKLRWTREEQWSEIRNGLSKEEVTEALGRPPRTVQSMKPRVDRVFYYETSIGGSAKDAMSGKVSFYKGKVVSFNKPDFGR